MSLRVGIVDYFTCNISSVYNSVLNIGENPSIIQDRKDIKKFDKIIIPGVGSANRTMNYFYKKGFYDEILEFNLKQKYILGICLGMQIFSEKLFENGEIKGFSFFKSIVEPLKNLKEIKYNINIGWRNMHLVNYQNDKLKIYDNKKFYFCHSYYMNFANKNDKSIIGILEENSNIPSLVIKNNIWGIQCHPEKSQNIGKKFLKNFLDI